MNDAYALRKKSMLRALAFYFFFAATLCSLSTLASATSLSDALSRSDHILLMRHARAPGVGDPSQFQIGDCRSQRNLDATGKAQAVKIGKWLREQGVASATVFSSPWCRCIDTSNLLGFQEVQVQASLGSFFNDTSVAAESTRQFKQLVAAALLSKGQGAAIFVTHQVNISAYVGETVSSGALVLAKVRPDGELISYSLLPDIR